MSDQQNPPPPSAPATSVYHRNPVTTCPACAAMRQDGIDRHSVGDAHRRYGAHIPESPAPATESLPEALHAAGELLNTLTPADQSRLIAWLQERRAAEIASPAPSFAELGGVRGIGLYALEARNVDAQFLRVHLDTERIAMLTETLEEAHDALREIAEIVDCPDGGNLVEHVQGEYANVCRIPLADHDGSESCWCVRWSIAMKDFDRIEFLEAHREYRVVGTRWRLHIREALDIAIDAARSSSLTDTPEGA